jgi:hypothetical protein
MIPRRMETTWLDENMSNKFKGDFHGCEVDFRDELLEARKLMGLKSTDLELLFEKVTLLYLNCPAELMEMYQATMWEIQRRQEILLGINGMSSWAETTDENDDEN